MYTLKISLLNEDGDEVVKEIVPTVSEEQGNEAVHRIVSYYENQLKVKETNEDEE
jgi:hypothetical protein